MSSRRERSGGTAMLRTLMRWYRSSRKVPRAISSDRFLLVAETMRTSTGRLSELPTGVTCPSWTTRRSLAWVIRLMSPISSRNRVPPWALSNFPLRSLTAPVKAPFTWPNISLSMSSAGMAAQLISMKGRSRRGETAWMARAMSSLPVPLSPETKTRHLVGAAISTSW
jgi:hypothetical protein